jgi:hypothetical protein
MITSIGFDELSGDCAKPVRRLVGKTVLKLNGFAVDITEIIECFRQHTQIDIFFLSVCSMPKNADARYLFALLRVRGDWPHRSRAAEKHDEIAPPHCWSPL